MWVDFHWSITIIRFFPKIRLFRPPCAVAKHRPNLTELLSALLAQHVEFQTFSKLLKNSLLYVSSSYCKGLRVSSYCTYHSSSGVVHGKILTFGKTFLQSPRYYALISRADQTPLYLDHYVQFTTGNDCVDLISVSDIVGISYCLHRDDELFLMDPVKSFEYEWSCE